MIQLFWTTVTLFTNASRNRVNVEIQFRRRYANLTLVPFVLYTKNRS